MGMRVILGDIMIAGIAVMMMLSIIPATAQPIEVDSNVPQTDGMRDATCLLLIKLAPSLPEKAREAVERIIEKQCV